MPEKRKVLLPQPIAPEAHELLERSGCEVVVAEDVSYETVAPLMRDAQAVVLRTGISITADLLKEADKLLTVSRTGGGVDNVDLDAATEHGVIVTSSLGVNTSSVVEHTIALMVSLVKQLPVLDREVRGNNYRIRYKNLPRDLKGMTVGVVGFGRIGSLFASICSQSFGMSVKAYDEYLPDQVKKQYSDWVDFTDLDTLMKESDVISLHIPATPETKKMINRRYFQMMKNDAVLLNASRGEVIDEADLAAALENGDIGAAGIDVFEQEPPDADNPLLKAPNTILTPHAAALTNECVVRMAVSGAQRVIDLFEGKTPANIANPDVLKQDRWKKFRK